MSAARHDRLAAPVTWVDILQRLGYHPFVAERVDEAGLPLPIGLIVRSAAGVRAVGAGSLEHGANVINADHHLIGCLRRAFFVPKFTNDQLGTLTVETKLNPMTLTDANMLDQTQHSDIPSDRPLHVLNAKHRNDPRPRG